MEISKNQRPKLIDIPGKNLAEINHELSLLEYSDLQYLMRSLNCTIGDLAIKIAAAKGIKCSKKEKQKL